jgi:hypothetical protein
MAQPIDNAGGRSRTIRGRLIVTFTGMWRGFRWLLGRSRDPGRLAAAGSRFLARHAAALRTRTMRSMLRSPHSPSGSSASVLADADVRLGSSSSRRAGG